MSFLKHLAQVPYVKASNCTIYVLKSYILVCRCSRSFWPAQTSFNRLTSSFQVGSNCTILALSPKHNKGMQESWQYMTLQKQKGISMFTSFRLLHDNTRETCTEQAESNKKEQVILDAEIKAPPGLTGRCLHHNLRSKAWHVTSRIRASNSSKIRSTYGKWCSGRETLTSQ